MLRSFNPEDAERLADVFRDAVRTIGPQAYTEQQVRVWALYPDDIDEFRARLSRGLTLVAEENGRVVAFGQLEPDDHLAFLYCSGSHCRRGIGSAIYRELEAHAFRKGVVQIHTEASRISRPFFAKHGYDVSEVEKAVRFGVEFERFRMLAVERYRLKHDGALPPSLADVAAELSGGVPEDPFDGQPLRYNVLPARGYTVYSVGADRKDDGGAALGTDVQLPLDVEMTIWGK